MAQAVEQHTAREWNLTDYHRYVRITLGCGINVARREMERRIVSGQVLLRCREFDADGNFKDNAVEIDRFDFLSNYSLQLVVSGEGPARVVVAPRNLETGLLPGGVSTIMFDESDPNGGGVRIWHRRAIEDDLFYYTVVEQDAQPLDTTVASPLKPKAWLPVEHERRKQQKNIPKDITTYARQLHNAAVEAAGQRRLTNAPTARRIETLLHDLGLFPKIQRRTKHAQNTHD